MIFEAQVRGIATADVPATGRHSSRAATPPLISAVVVSWNTREELRECLRSLQTQPDVETIVVDNHSSDGTAAMVRGEFPHAVLLHNERNLGYAKAVNRGVRAARGTYLLILNADVVVIDLAPLARTLQAHPEVGVVGPRLLNTDGSHQPSTRTFPTPWELLCRFTLLGRVTPRPNLHHDVGPEEERDVDQVSGAALFMRKDFFERLGGMDEDFYCFYEDVDFCRRVWKAGRRVRFLGTARMIHHGGRSRRQAEPTLTLAYVRSLLTYVDKRYGRRFGTFYRWAFKPLYILNLCCQIGWDLAALPTRPARRLIRLKSRIHMLTRHLPAFVVEL
jgi:GT2 family glycosyltransferase